MLPVFQEICRSFLSYVTVVPRDEGPETSSKFRTYNVKGLDCAACSIKVQDAIAAIPGVKMATLVYETGQLRVTADDYNGLLPKMQAAAEKAEDGVIITERVRATAQKKYRVYKVEGLDCAACSVKVQDAIAALPIVDEAVLVYETGQLRISARSYDGLLPLMQEAADRVEEGVKIFIGGPLLEAEEDVKDVADILDNEFGKYVKGNNVMAFLGHGNPANLNYGNGNQRYFDLEAALQKKNPNYFVATVDQEDNLVDNLYERMQDQGKVTTGATLTLHALMCIAGDHAHNDMSGIENEDDSWREFFVKKGFKCEYDGNDANPSNNCILKGLGDYAAIRAIWKQHTKDAEEMFAEEEE